MTTFPVTIIRFYCATLHVQLASRVSPLLKSSCEPGIFAFRMVYFNARHGSDGAEEMWFSDSATQLIPLNEVSARIVTSKMGKNLFLVFQKFLPNNFLVPRIFLWEKRKVLLRTYMINPGVLCKNSWAVFILSDQKVKCLGGWWLYYVSVRY